MKSATTSRRIFAALLGIVAALPVGGVLGAISAGYLLDRSGGWLQLLFAAIAGAFWVSCVFDEVYRAITGDQLSPPASP